ncbi:hypothetical protein MES5069_130076 [Mesorhizobium escarrei]|uniref:Uncharacterized protein n=1 Tax=Mesorhizobium escarrei TaxID=666018 RepID=A0ABM9DHT0_9HYPH|nr:hypothetical protein MES5069_130076 [Mesorhizobium escarrei]
MLAFRIATQNVLRTGYSHPTVERYACGSPVVGSIAEKNKPTTIGRRHVAVSNFPGKGEPKRGSPWCSNQGRRAQDGVRRVHADSARKAPGCQTYRGQGSQLKRP